MKILITGANGMVAKAVAEFCRRIGDEVFALTREELDISDKENVSKTISQIKPDAIINCAAYTNVDTAETNKEKCFAANYIGVKNLAEAAKDCRSIFLTISTDYVFDGEKQGFYNESDTAKPQSIYAKSKYDGEKIATETYSSSIIVRTGWIFGKDGTNFLSVMPKLLADGKKIKVVKDSFGTPTYTLDLAKRLRELVSGGNSGIFNVTNSGGGTSYAGFAESICELGNFDEKLIEKITDAELSRPASRPNNSRLACLRAETLGFEPLQHWNNALEDFLKQEDIA